jgi:hypothetical protein
MRMQPSRNYSPIEVVVYATAAQGFATKVNGTNQLTRTSGSNTDAANWVGEKIYWEDETYRVSAVSGNTISVTTLAGGPVTFSGNSAGVFHLFWVEATGTCTVSGSTVTRVSGDPFLPFVSDSSHHFTLNGTKKNVASFVSPDVMTINYPPAAGTYTYKQRMDVDDTMTQFRIQKFFGDYEENLTFGAKPWGYFIRSQGYSSSQGYRPLWLGSGENKAQLALMPNGTLRIGDHGKIRAPGTNGFNYLEIDGGTAGQYSPTIRGRGPDANVSVAVDTKGTGEFVVTGNSFGKFLIRANTAGIGFNGASIQAPPSLGAAATTPETTMTLVNKIRAALIANGLATA